MFGNLRLVHFHCSLSLYFDAKATRAFVAGLFVLLFVCSPTTECVTIIPTNDLGHESKSQFNPSFCSQPPFFAPRQPNVIDQDRPGPARGLLPGNPVAVMVMRWMLMMVDNYGDDDCGDGGDGDGDKAVAFLLLLLNPSRLIKTDLAFFYQIIIDKPTMTMAMTIFW